MKQLNGVRSWFFKLGMLTLGGAALACGFSLAAQSPAAAQAAYGSYVGIGGSLGLTDGSEAAGEGSNSGVVIAARYRLLRLPVSLRAQALISERTTLVPTISYDIPLDWQTDLYVGAGVSVPLGGGDAEDTSPLGNQTSFVLQPGIDYSFPNSNLVLFGNAIIAFDAYEEGAVPQPLCKGVGLRF